MIWPFNRITEAQKRIEKAEKAVAEARTIRYQRLFELDDMVRRSLVLLEPKKHEPPST